MTQKTVYKYKMKVTSKSDKNVVPLGTKEQFDTIDDLKLYAADMVESFEGTIGYIEPGHGLKGKLIKTFTGAGARYFCGVLVIRIVWFICTCD